MNTPEIPPPPNLPTIPDHAPMSVRVGRVIRFTLPGAVVAALISAGTTVALTRATQAEPARDSVAELRGDVRALAVRVDALAQAQRDLLERINRDQDAAANARLVEALKANARLVEALKAKGAAAP
jgi:hypothetical protein